MKCLSAFVLVTACVAVSPLSAQPAAAPPPAPDRATILKAAEQVMKEARYCALITVGEDGQPQARAIDAFPAEEHFVVWIGTNPKTRKVAEITRNPRVTLYYFDPKDPGYVTLLGRAEIVDDAAEKAKRWKEDWASFYKDRNKGDDYVLIKVTPYRLEVVSYTHKVLNDGKTWAVPGVALPGR